LKKEYFGSRINIEMLNMYGETIDRERFMVKRVFPLHRKLKNVYRQNITHQAEIRKLKVELQPFREELKKNNLDILNKVAPRITSIKKRQSQ